MESLYRKYRPLTFDQVVGQTHVVDTLEHAIQEARTTHAYLFSGPRGTGKTTLARILAKAMVCEAGPGNLPDGTCVQCTEIAEGTHPDVYELDAASRTGVDAVREEIVNRVDYAPTQGRAKVYIIDEVHMLTTQAFNALLKTLEEPPEHVVFVLCTTDPQKIPATILSRVQRFDFRPIATSDIEKHLQYISDQEGFTADPTALSLVTRHAQGGMRDAISLLEQLSVFGNGNLSLEKARALLGEVESSSLSAVMDALAQNDTVALFAEVARALEAGDDIQQFASDLISYLRDVYVISIAGAAPGVLEATPETLEALQKTAANFGMPARIANLLELFDQTVRAMRFSPQPRLDLEVAFARATKPSLVWEEDALQALEKRLEALEAGSGTSPKSAQSAQETLPVSQPQAVSQQQQQPTPQPQSVAQQESAPQSQPVQQSTPQAQSTPQPATAPPTQVPANVAWPKVIAAAKTEQPAIHGLIVNSIIVEETEKELKIASKNYSPFFEGKLNGAEEKKYLQDAMRKAGNSKILTFVAGSTPQNSEPEPLVQKMPANFSHNTPEPIKEPAQTAPVAQDTNTPTENISSAEQNVLNMIADSFGSAPKILSTDEGEVPKGTKPEEQ